MLDDNYRTNKLELGLAAANTASYIAMCTVGVLIYVWMYSIVLIALQVCGSLIMFYDRRSTEARRVAVRKYWRSLSVMPIGFILGVLVSIAIFRDGPDIADIIFGYCVAAVLGMYPSIVFLRMYLRTSP